MIEPSARRRFARFLIRSDPMDSLFVDHLACFERCRDRARIGIEAVVPMRALLFADPPETVERGPGS